MRLLGLRRRGHPEEAAPGVDRLDGNRRSPNQAPEPPWAFTHIHLHYVATGRDLDPVKVERAIKLSQDKYCSVAATIRGVTEITFDFEVRSEA